MRRHPVELAVWLLVGPFVYFHTSSTRTVKALARLHGCADSPEPSQVAYVISTIISWAGSLNVLIQRTTYHLNVIPATDIYNFFITIKVKPLRIPNFPCYFCGLIHETTESLAPEAKVITTELVSYYIWATSWENLFMPYANNKGADQPVPDQRLCHFLPG